MVRSSKSTGSSSPTEKGIDEKKESARKKVWKPKTKTGCITCRIRRVKCDEGKPDCHRCASTGRKCDGYANPAPSSHSRQIVNTVKGLPKSLIPRLSLDSTEEHEAFHFYKQRSATELSGFFDSGFWQIEILQASHTLPAIRHALIALAAMHRKLIVGRMPVVPDDTSDKELRFALQQSNCAIKEIVNSPVKTTLSNRINMMTTCILFHCLACIQGHQRLALEHLRSGLKILKEVDDDMAAGINEVSDHPISLSTLRAMFVTMDVRARGIMCEDMLANWGPTPKRDVQLHPTTFKTFDQARFFFEATFHQIMRFMQDMDLNAPASEEDSKVAALEFQHIVEHFNEGSRRLNRFYNQLKSAATSQEDQDALISIQLIHDQTKVYLRAFPGFDGQKHVRELAWHIDEQDMATMLDLSCQLLKAPPDLTIPAGARPEEYYTSPADREYTTGQDIPSQSRPIFCSGSSLLSALWLVASRAYSSALRRKAAALLLDYPRREGVWDSVLAGRIAWEILILEETAQDGELGVYRDQTPTEPPGDLVEPCNKVLDIIIDYVDMRVATVEYRTARHLQEGRRGYKSQIAW